MGTSEFSQRNIGLDSGKLKKYIKNFLVSILLNFKKSQLQLKSHFLIKKTECMSTMVLPNTFKCTEMCALIGYYPGGYNYPGVTGSIIQGERVVTPVEGRGYVSHFCQSHFWNLNAKIDQKLKFFPTQNSSQWVKSFLPSS